MKRLIAELALLPALLLAGCTKQKATTMEETAQQIVNNSDVTQRNLHFTTAEIVNQNKSHPLSANDKKQILTYINDFCASQAHLCDRQSMPSDYSSVDAISEIEDRLGLAGLNAMTDFYTPGAPSWELDEQKQLNKLSTQLYQNVERVLVNASLLPANTSDRDLKPGQSRHCTDRELKKALKDAAGKLAGCEVGRIGVDVG